jgi:predicted metalloprotease
MVRRTIAVGLAVALGFAAACAQEATDNPLVATTPDRPGPDETPSDRQPRTPETRDEVVEAAIRDIEAFWEEAYPAIYGSPLEPIAGGYHPYGPDTPLPECGGIVPDYPEIAENAFYCPESDLIAWDEGRLFPELERQFGPFTLGLVLAHEFAHGVQARAGFLGLHDTIATELQADCYAGAWTGWVADGNSPSFEITEDKLDSSVAGMIAISDVPGTGADDPQAHGSGFDRIGAFQEGFQQGPGRCSEYPDLYERGQLPIVQIPFQSAEDAARGGDLHLEDQGPDNPGVYSLAIDSLDRFYAELFGQLGATWTPIDTLALVAPGRDSVACGGTELSGSDLEFIAVYCEDENIVVLDEAGLVPSLYEIGDFAVAAELGHLWAIAAQIQLGVFGNDVESSLQADCLTGVWASTMFPDEQGRAPLGDVVLSPGDLDEAIMGFLTYGDTLSDQLGTAFDRTSALRAGFVEGAAACEEFGALS